MTRWDGATAAGGPMTTRSGGGGASALALAVAVAVGLGGAAVPTAAVAQGVPAEALPAATASAVATGRSSLDPARPVLATPQGRVGPAVRQVRVRFDRAVGPAGDPRAPDPYALACTGTPGGAAPAGQGRWLGDLEWVYDLRDPLPPGVACELRPASAAVAAPAGGWRFATGGPGVVQVRPWPGETIDEAQHLVLTFNGAVQPASVARLARCEVQGVSDRQPVRVVDGPEREATLAAQAPARPGTARFRTWADRTVVLACERPLPPQAKVTLIIGPGVAARDGPATGPSGGVPFTAGWTVRPAFTAEFSCERERAQAPCWPVRPLVVRFSAPVARADAARVRLVAAEGGRSWPAVVDAPADEPFVQVVRFPVPLPERAALRIELPAGLRDDAGRALANAATFPLAVATGDAPPIAKFAAAPFGILERGLAEPRAGRAPAGPDGRAAPAPAGILPITLRHVQVDWGPDALRRDPPPGVVRAMRLTDPAEILAWHGRLQRFHESTLTAREAGRPRADWFEWHTEADERGRERRVAHERVVGSREVSLLRADSPLATGRVEPAVPPPGTAMRDFRPPPAPPAPPPLRPVTRLALPASPDGPGEPRPFEVVGLPLAEPGYHVVEVESARLGAALLDRPAPMYVRTGMLVTNLGVHVKHGRESSVVWVTRLDRGRPVAGAEVLVHDCRGTRLWQGTTDAQGLARIDQALDARPPAQRRARETGEGWDAEAARCTADEGLYVVARTADDLAFAFSTWQRGIEPWRFDLPVADPLDAVEPGLQAHTVFDRTLLRAGETVSMKHFLRVETRRGLALPEAALLPDGVVLQHVGSGQETRIPLQDSGARSATSSWAIPPAARLGAYAVYLERRAPAAVPAAPRRWAAGDFRVEAFRVPLIDAKLVPPPAVPVAPRELPLAVQVQYLSGGGLAQQRATVSALLVPRSPTFPGLDGFRFDPPVARGPDGSTSVDDDEDEAGRATPGRLVADRVPAPTDRLGAGRVVLAGLPAVTRPSELLAELSVDDPSGERQTTALRLPLWPSERVVGIQAASFGREDRPLAVQVVALDTAGRPVADQPVAVSARLTVTTTVRKRLVGGFYGYDNRTESQDLGTVCEGRTDARGRLACDARIARGGDVELVASTADAQGRRAEAATRAWISGAADAWFAQDDDDRIALRPERDRYAPGETARIQVRMPFREATVLVSVEREGVIATRVQRLRADDPVIALPIERDWGPNVVVSVVALRGRVRDVPWTSFFDWGWRAPLDWWRAFRDEGPDHRAPTALVDLARPSFKLGAVGLGVSTEAQALQVAVTTDKPVWRVRETVPARIRVTQDGKPLPAGTVEVAFAAVDEGLLALRPNDSWNLLDGLVRPRPWSVATATGHGEIVGRRHYGRKAVAPGGGGGRGATRELFDTLLVWRARVAVDANGEAVVPVPLNDSMTRFRLVAVADAVLPDGRMAFGQGAATVSVTQDLQVLPGLPLAVREGDRFDARVTVRNTTERELALAVTLAADGLAVPPAQSVALPAGASRELAFPVQVPDGLAASRDRIAWTVTARETTGANPRVDRVQREQALHPAVPVRTWAATMRLLDGPLDLPVAPPAGALADGDRPRGGVGVALQASLAQDLPGVRRWFEAYPFTCLEQQAARAVGLGDAARWQAVLAALPSYLDGDGLAGFFPTPPGAAPAGSDRLTAHLVSLAHEAGLPLPDAVRDPMLAGLLAYVEGRLERRPSAYGPGGEALDRDVRRLAAMAALARHGRLEPRHLGTVRPQPATWPTAALIDWITVLGRLDLWPGREAALAQARRQLRDRLVAGGTALRFAREADDDWWWLMDNADANAARLLLLAADDPAWRDDLPRLLVGHLERQRLGAWSTTTANAWSVVAMRRVAQRVEAGPVGGRTVARLGAAEAVQAWGGAGTASTASPTVPTTPVAPAAAASTVVAGGSVAGAGAAAWLALPWPGSAGGTLGVRHEGPGRPWVSVQQQAAVPLTAPVAAGYRVRRSVQPVEQRQPGRLTAGDIVRVTLEVEAFEGRTWVVVSDPLPAGATVLGSGLGGDPAILAGAPAQAGRGDRAGIAPAWVERLPHVWRGYFEDLPRGRHVVTYTVRLSNAGRFALPPTRVEAMYAPETFGESPNPAVEVAAP